MMRVSKILGCLVAVGAAIVALSTTTESRADPPPEALVNVTCNKGDVTATLIAAGKKDGWHLNAKAPWKWDKGTKVSVDQDNAKFHGDKCEGTLKAYICKGEEQCVQFEKPVR